jgi:hypothetical protein
MQVHPGVFVSSTSTEEWQSDREIGGGAQHHVLVDTGAMGAGLSRCRHGRGAFRLGLERVS